MNNPLLRTVSDTDFNFATHRPCTAGDAFDDASSGLVQAAQLTQKRANFKCANRASSMEIMSTIISRYYRDIPWSIFDFFIVDFFLS